MKKVSSPRKRPVIQVIVAPETLRLLDKDAAKSVCSRSEVARQIIARHYASK
jgi:hypothetical protein